MKLLAGKRKIVAVGGAAAAIIAIGSSSAFAYFSSSGTATGSASVGSATPFVVAAGGAGTTSGTIYPGGAGQTLLFTVSNQGSGDQEYTTDIATVVASNKGYVEQSGKAVQGCLASWFKATITTDTGLNTVIAAGASKNATVTVTMPTDSTDNQDACQGVNPDVTFAVSK